MNKKPKVVVLDKRNENQPRHIITLIMDGERKTLNIMNEKEYKLLCWYYEKEKTEEEKRIEEEEIRNAIEEMRGRKLAYMSKFLPII